MKTWVRWGVGALMAVGLGACKTASQVAMVGFIWTGILVIGIVALPFMPLAIVEYMREPRQGPATVAFAPDGEALVAAYREGPYQRLHRVALDGSLVTPLTTGKRFDLEPVFSPDGTTMVFPSAVEHPRSKKQMNLYVANADGSELRPLTTGKTYDICPQFSPDGRLVVYASSQRGKEADLYVVDREGGERRRLTTGEDNDLYPFILPDGETVIFARATYYGHYSPIASSDWHDWDWYMVRLDGTGLTRLTEECYYTIRWAELGREGERLLYFDASGFASDSTWLMSLEGEPRVEMVRPKGERYERVKEGKTRTGRFDAPRLSPDGDRLLFVMDEESEKGYKRELHVMEIGTGEARALTDVDKDIRTASWSADGEKMAFLAGESDIKDDMFLELWVMSADGTGLREIEIRKGKGEGDQEEEGKQEQEENHE